MNDSKKSSFFGERTPEEIAADRESLLSIGEIQPAPVRGRLFAFAFAFSICFALVNILIAAFLLFVAICRHQSLSFVYKDIFPDLIMYAMILVTFMVGETLAYGSAIVAYVGSRRYKSLRYVFFKSILGSRAGRPACSPGFVTTTRRW